MIAISVTVPVYNVEKYLKRCLDTILDQTFSLKYEIICVNDGSTDNSPKILEEYQKKYPNIIKIITQENKGLSEARNTALKHVKGKYTMFVDADDFIARNTLEGLYNYAESHNSDVVVFDFLQAWEGKEGLKRCHCENILKKYGETQFNIQSAEPFVFKDISCATWSKFYLTELVRNIKFEKGLINQDVCHWTEVFVKAKRINYYPVPFYFYACGRESSITECKGRKLFDVFKVFNITKNILKKSGYYEKYKEIHYNFMGTYLIYYMGKMYPELRKDFVCEIKNYEMDVNFDNILNGNYLKYEKENIYLMKLIKENDYKTVEQFCQKVGIWKKIT